MGPNTEVVLKFRDVILRDIDQTLILARERDSDLIERGAEREGERNAREAMDKACDKAREVLGREHTPKEHGDAVGDCKAKEKEYLKELAKPD